MASQDKLIKATISKVITTQDYKKHQDIPIRGSFNKKALLRETTISVPEL